MESLNFARLDCTAQNIKLTGQIIKDSLKNLLEYRRIGIMRF